LDYIEVLLAQKRLADLLKVDLNVTFPRNAGLLGSGQKTWKKQLPVVSCIHWSMADRRSEREEEKEEVVSDDKDEAY
jgi:hypothetical protein